MDLMRLSLTPVGIITGDGRPLTIRKRPSSVAIQRAPGPAWMTLTRDPDSLCGTPCQFSSFRENCNRSCNPLPTHRPAVLVGSTPQKEPRIEVVLGGFKRLRPLGVPAQML